MGKQISTADLIDKSFVQFYCNDCKQTSTRTVKAVRLNPNGCGVCSGKIVIPGFNDALTRLPTIKEIWDYDRNEKSPQDYTHQSGRKVWVNCPKCEQSTQRRVCDVVRIPNSCSVCSGKSVISGFNDLETLFPDLAKQWSSNNKKLAAETYPWGRLRGKWFCEVCGGEWETTVGGRVKYRSGCPYCSNQKVLKGFNDLSTTHPFLLTFWDYMKNKITPDQITGGSNQKVWWKCGKGHSWKASPSSRYDSKTRKAHDCNRCSRAKRSSRGEKELYEFCKSLVPTTQSTKTVIPGIEFDVWIPSLQIAVEYNGEYWHSSQVMKEKYGLNSYQFHLERKSRAESKGIGLYYVWENDWVNNRFEVEAALQSLLETGELFPILTKLEGILNSS